MQEIAIALCGVAGVAAAALVRRARKAKRSALDSERRVLESSISLLEHDPAYDAERKALLPGYRSRLKDIRQAMDGKGATPVSESGAVDLADDAGGASDASGMAKDPGTPAVAGSRDPQPDVEPTRHAEAAPDPPQTEAPQAPSKGHTEPMVEAAQPAEPTTAEAAQTAEPQPPEPGISEPTAAEPTTAEAVQTAEPQPPEPPQAETAQPPEPPAAEPPAAEPTPESSKAKTPPPVMHAPPSAMQTVDIPDTPSSAEEQPPAAAPSGSGKAADMGPRTEPDTTSGDRLTDTDTHVDNVPEEAVGEGDDVEDLEKIKADIIKTLNKLQRAGDD